MRILFMIGAMGAGGAERVMARLAAHFSADHAVRLLTYERPGVRPFYPVPSRVELTQIDVLGGRGAARLWRLGTRVPKIRRVIREFEPDVVLSFMNTTNLEAILASVGFPIGVVVSERTDPAQHSRHAGVVLLRRLLYPLAHRVVATTSRAAAYFSGPGITVIPNPIAAADRRADPSKPGPDGRFQVIAVGRLDPDKRIDRLVDAFASLAERFPLWDVVICGDGEDKNRLEAIVARHRLDGRVRFLGTVRDMSQELSRAHIMAFPSRYEGFPNALGEAMAAGLPAVGHVGVSGVEDLIEDGVTGFLVRNGTDAFRDGLERLMGDAHLRGRLGAAGLARVERWSETRVLPLWEEILTAAARQGRGTERRTATLT